MNAPVPLSDITAAVDAADERAAQRAEAQMAAQMDRLGVEWDLRLANAIQYVQLCRIHDGRGEGPWSAHDASIVRTIADPAHLVAGQTPSERATFPEAASAIASERRLDARIEAGVAASAIAPPAEAPVDLAAAEG